MLQNGFFFNSKNSIKLKTVKIHNQKRSILSLKTLQYLCINILKSLRNHCPEFRGDKTLYQAILIRNLKKLHNIVDILSESKAYAERSFSQMNVKINKT